MSALDEFIGNLRHAARGCGELADRCVTALRRVHGIVCNARTPCDTNLALVGALSRFLHVSQHGDVDDEEVAWAGIGFALAIGSNLVPAAYWETLKAHGRLDARWVILTFYNAPWNFDEGIIRDLVLDISRLGIESTVHPTLDWLAATGPEPEGAWSAREWVDFFRSFVPWRRG